MQGRQVLLESALALRYLPLTAAAAPIWLGSASPFALRLCLQRGSAKHWRHQCRNCWSWSGLQTERGRLGHSQPLVASGALGGTSYPRDHDRHTKPKKSSSVSHSAG
jgi:hypothetical protein